MSTRPGHQQRLLDEQAQLDHKRERMAGYFATPAYKGLDPIEQERLHFQLDAMTLYSKALGRRIKPFMVDPAVLPAAI